MKKNLLAVHLNEFNYKYLKEGAKKYKKNNILNFLTLSKLDTFTRDKKQNKDLDPWVQSVSINVGKSSKSHKILNLGESLKKKTNQIWDVLSKKKISCSIWGTMNSKLNKNDYIQLYFPDPWNFSDQIIPKKLNNLFYLPRYFSKNYTNVSIFRIIYYSIYFLFSSLQNGCLNFYLKYFFLFSKIILKKGLKNYILFFIFDLISLHIFYERLRKNKSQFSLIFLNSLAHFQHNNWDEKENEKYYFIFADIIISYILKISKNYQSTIIYNGFTQKKIKTEYLLRPRDPTIFLKKLNLNFIKIEQDMTNGGVIFFRNKKELDINKKKLNQFKVFGLKPFKITILSNKTLFYKIQIKTFSKLNELNLNQIKKYNYRNFFSYYDKKKFKFFISDRFKNEEIFFSNIEFIKCTGKHVNSGIILKKNFNIKEKLKLENHKIFENVVRHFSL
tara:strand:- start:400 stop:1734 length:1335 start_codon:yes stop_codon:yes gene_type:complete